MLAKECEILLCGICLIKNVTFYCVEYATSSASMGHIPFFLLRACGYNKEHCLGTH